MIDSVWPVECMLMLSMASSSESTTLTPMVSARYSVSQSWSVACFMARLGMPGRLDDGERPLVGVQLDTLVGERLRRGRQEPFGHVTVDQQLFGGVAYADALRLRVDDDGDRLVEVAAAVDIDMDVAGSGRR